MQPRLTILLVDDDDADLALFDLAVEKADLDIRVETVTSGKEAIEYLEGKGAYADRAMHPWPDLVVLDLKMPGFNGFDFLAWRGASRMYSSIPVIVLSGSNDPVDEKMAGGMGVCKHIVKPGEFAEWKHVIREVWDMGTQGSSCFQAEWLRTTRGG